MWRVICLFCASMHVVQGEFFSHCYGSAKADSEDLLEVDLCAQGSFVDVISVTVGYTTTTDQCLALATAERPEVKCMRESDGEFLLKHCSGASCAVPYGEIQYEYFGNNASEECLLSYRAAEAANFVHVIHACAPRRSSNVFEVGVNNSGVYRDRDGAMFVLSPKYDASNLYAFNLPICNVSTLPDADLYVSVNNFVASPSSQCPVKMYVGGRQGPLCRADHESFSRTGDGDKHIVLKIDASPQAAWRFFLHVYTDPRNTDLYVNCDAEKRVSAEEARVTRDWRHRAVTAPDNAPPSPAMWTTKAPESQDQGAGEQEDDMKNGVVGMMVGLSAGVALCVLGFATFKGHELRRKRMNEARKEARDEETVVNNS